MTDLYLKYADEAESFETLYGKKEEIIIGEDGEEIIILVPDLTKPLFANIDTIGVIYEPMPDPLPEPPPEPAAMEGWHVNVRVVAGEDAEPLQQFSVVPQSPRRVWG